MSYNTDHLYQMSAEDVDSALSAFHAAPPIIKKAGSC